MTGLVPGRSLWRIVWRGLTRHATQTILMVIGIALGVAVVIAIDIANASASRAFDLSVDSVAGRATHQIVGGPGGLDETVYAELRRMGAVRAAAPIISEYISSPQIGSLTLHLLGVDPFAEAPFRDYLVGEHGVPVEQLTRFLTEPGAIMISTDLAARYGLEIGDRINLNVGGLVREAVIVGVLEPQDDLGRRALDGLILADIATAQELTGRAGRLDHIDLILPDPEAQGKVESLLRPPARLIPVEGRSGAVDEMTRAFRINLTALSLLALLVGLFLIYNAMTFSVIQRRALFGTLRCLGVTRREIFALVVSEALVIGLVGAGLGSALGIVMGDGAVQMVTQTINDLYFVITVRNLGIPPLSLLKGALLGVVATVLTAAPPAWEAASVPPRAALSRSSLESKARWAVTATAIGGVSLISAGVVTLLLPTRDLVVSFAGTFGAIVGAAMLTPGAMTLLMQAASRIASGGIGGVLGRMAPRNVAASLSRTSISVAALMVAVSVTIGVSVMVSSFRHTVVLWLERTLQGDIYLSVPGGTASSPSRPIEPEVLAAVEDRPGIARADILRAVTVDSPAGPVDLAAVFNPDDPVEQIYYTLNVPRSEVWNAMVDGAVLVSEPLARRLELPRRGGEIALYTDSGLHVFPVVGIYYDYASNQGTVLMSLPTYRAWWNDSTITAVALRLEPGQDVDSTVSELQQELSSIQQLRIISNRALREDVLAIFDRTFAITGALQMLATGVAFIGVLSALLSLQLEKQRELGILRALGLTTRQIWRLVLLETGLMGASAGLLAMPVGYGLAIILVYIINRRAFGWTLQMQVELDPFVLALMVAVAAALLAGIYPAYRMGRMVTAEAIRFE